jgi:hypothetical protein
MILYAKIDAFVGKTLKTLICHLMHEFVRPQTTDVHKSVMYNNLDLISSINYSDHYF